MKGKGAIALYAMLPSDRIEGFLATRRLWNSHLIVRPLIFSYNHQAVLRWEPVWKGTHIQIEFYNPPGSR